MRFKFKQLAIFMALATIAVASLSTIATLSMGAKVAAADCKIVICEIEDTGKLTYNFQDKGRTVIIATYTAKAGNGDDPRDGRTATFIDNTKDDIHNYVSDDTTFFCRAGSSISINNENWGADGDQIPGQATILLRTESCNGKVIKSISISTSPPSGGDDGGGGGDSGFVYGELKDNPIVKDINTIVNFLSIGVGVVVIAMLIVGGIQYSIAGDNATAVSAAKQRMTNAGIALLAYLLVFAFLQWLIPGGIF